MNDLRKELSQAQRIVVKIGSSVFFKDGVRVDRPAFASLIEGLDGLMRGERAVFVVSSGAVAMGRQHLGEMARESREIPQLQAYASMGQARLIQMYESEFSHYGRKVAQVLFSRDDLSDRSRYINARRTLERLEEFGAVPIINENDTVATEELRFGDNDELAAMTAGLVGADLLILLSDVDGLKRVEIADDGERKLMDRVDAIDVDDRRVDEWAGPSATEVGTGGMISKVEAARIAARNGTLTVIARGKKSAVLKRIADGEVEGTVFEPGETTREAVGRKVWLSSGARAKGEVVCDQGAREAIRQQGASLLPSGVVEVRGDFSEGEVVELVDHRGEAFGRGRVVYGAADLEQIAGFHSSKIEDILGFKLLDEAVHRDNMVVL